MYKESQNQQTLEGIIFKSRAANKFTADLNTAIDDKKIITTRHTLYVTKEISGASNQVKLLTPNTEKLTGICNFNGNKTERGEGFVYNGISFGYGTGNLANVGLGGIKYLKALPAGLLNAELVIRQDNNTHISIPVSDIVSEGTPTAAGDYVLDLGLYGVLRDDSKVDFELHFPEDGSGMPAKGEAPASADEDHVVKVKMIGAVTRTRS